MRGLQRLHVDPLSIDFRVLNLYADISESGTTFCRLHVHGSRRLIRPGLFHTGPVPFLTSQPANISSADVKSAGYSVQTGTVLVDLSGLDCFYTGPVPFLTSQPAHTIFC